MEDKIIESSGQKYSLRKILDSEESWQKYVNGSEKFKQAVELGITMQLAQVNIAFAELDEAKARLKNI